jgi:selenide,water dikinase
MSSSQKLRLTELVSAAGCAAKLGPTELAAALGGLVPCQDPRLLVGPQTMDDAAVIRLGSELAICFTTDFITPLVDDPFDWGRIAATNAISDVYAMGGRPLAALNILCWNDCIAKEGLSRLLAGGAAAAQAADCSIVGGHSVSGKEPKYGLAVIGTVHPERVVRNCGAWAGDVLYLTKPLGTGILCTAMKAGDLNHDEYRSLVNSMTTLNRDACAAALQASVHAMTDVTGFGLLGHLTEMLGSNDDLGVSVHATALPWLPGVRRHIAMGMVPTGAARNRDAFTARVDFSNTVEDASRVVVFDPQTSGGLLVAIPPAQASAFECAAQGLGVSAVSIGEFDRSGRISVS